MDRILVQGGRPLSGTIRINGAKNAALPLMTAALLTDEPLVLENTPDVADIGSMWRLLQHLGCEARHLAGEPHKLALTCGKILATTAPYDIVRKMRASVLVLGPLLARAGAAKVSLPGGCAIGTRPIDMHLSAMERLGAEIVLEGGYVLARAPNGLRGGEVRFAQPSVGATENVLMAACLARGETYILGAAREPEIVDLAACLAKMGALIEGAGTHEIRVQGVERLAGTTHAVVPDRIEAGTYVMAAGITAGSLTIEGAKSEHFGTAAETLRRAGIALEATPHGLKAGLADGGLIGTDMMTRPFPGFATDLQAQFMALMCGAEGAAMITETIFENRFMHVPELTRLGAQITVHGGSALVRGGAPLRGAPVMATDLRASVSLVLAALAAEGETEVNRIYHLDRGYEGLVEKLQGVGASIERVP